jgi:hypothetical protein
MKQTVGMYRGVIQAIVIEFGEFLLAGQVPKYNARRVTETANKGYVDKKCNSN